MFYKTQHALQMRTENNFHLACLNSLRTPLVNHIGSCFFLSCSNFFLFSPVLSFVLFSFIYLLLMLFVSVRVVLLSCFFFVILFCSFFLWFRQLSRSTTLEWTRAANNDLNVRHRLEISQYNSKPRDISTRLF